jgi:hypothetical protein
MKLFMSWSGARSKPIAGIMKDWLEHIFPTGVDVWLSTQGDNLRAGSLSVPQIIKGLRESDYGVFCFTTDNTKSPWIMFEAGAICKQDKTRSEIEGVYTILFEGDIGNLIDTPLGSFQHTFFTEESMYNFFRGINNIGGQAIINEQRLQKNVQNSWSIYYPKIVEALGPNSVKGGAMNKEQLMEKLTEPYFGRPHNGQVTFYEKGFEDYPLYEILLKNAKKRFWVFGRKNRKIFDIRNDDYFGIIKTKTDFDFKCLFLDPESPDELLSSAQDTLGFSDKLKLCIKDAYHKLKSVDIDPHNAIRLYSLPREYAVIVVDDVVLFSPILYNKTSATDSHMNGTLGKPKHLTRSAFNLVSVDEDKAKFHMDKFLEVWNNAKKMETQP